MFDGTAKINLAKPESPYNMTPLGAPFHISPEMYEYHGKGHLSYRSYDIYAFGMLLWVLCEGTGTAPRKSTKTWKPLKPCRKWWWKVLHQRGFLWWAMHARNWCRGAGKKENPCKWYTLWQNCNWYMKNTCQKSMKSKTVLIEINYSIPHTNKISYTSMMLRDHAWQVNSLLKKSTLCKK